MFVHKNQWIFSEIQINFLYHWAKDTTTGPWSPMFECAAAQSKDFNSSPPCYNFRLCKMIRLNELLKLFPGFEMIKCMLDRIYGYHRELHDTIQLVHIDRSSSSDGKVSVAEEPHTFYHLDDRISEDRNNQDVRHIDNDSIPLTVYVPFTDDEITVYLYMANDGQQPNIVGAKVSAGQVLVVAGNQPHSIGTGYGIIVPCTYLVLQYQSQSWPFVDRNRRMWFGKEFPYGLHHSKYNGEPRADQFYDDDGEEKNQMDISS